MVKLLIDKEVLLLILFTQFQVAPVWNPSIKTSLINAFSTLDPKTYPGFSIKSIPEVDCRCHWCHRKTIQTTTTDPPSCSIYISFTPLWFYLLVPVVKPACTNVKRENCTYKFGQFPITARYLQIHGEEISGIEATTEGKTEPVYRHEHAKHSVISPDDGVLLQQLNSALSQTILWNCPRSRSWQLPETLECKYMWAILGLLPIEIRRRWGR